VQGSWTLADIESAHLCRLDETPLGALPVANGRVDFQVPPFAVSTIRVRRHEAAPTHV
jgi:hypothetical protein